jgi:hypothetical protein
MKFTMTALAVAALMLSGTPALSDDDCDDVLSSMEDAVLVATKVLEMQMAEVSKLQPQTDDEKASMKNKFCSASGEFVGVSRVSRYVSNECLKGNKRRDTVASLDKSIKELRETIEKTCR